MTDKDNIPKFEVFIEEGVCYLRFSDEISVDNILAAEAKAIVLMDEQKIDMLPFIVDLSAANDQALKIEIKDFGKIISFRELYYRCSGVWLVGASGSIKALINLLNKTFLENRLHFMESMSEAKEAAKAARDLKIPVLEQK